METITAGEYVKSYQPGDDTRAVRITRPMRTFEGVPTKVLDNAPYVHVTIDGTEHTLHEATAIQVA